MFTLYGYSRDGAVIRSKKIAAEREGLILSQVWLSHVEGVVKVDLVRDRSGAVVAAWPRRDPPEAP